MTTTEATPEPEPADNPTGTPACCPDEDRYWQACGPDCRIYDTSHT